MACGRDEDAADDVAVEVVPVTVLVVGATMMVVGSHEAVSESVAVGKRLVPNVSTDVDVGATDSVEVGRISELVGRGRVEAADE